MSGSPNLDRFPMVVQQVRLEAHGVVSLLLSLPDGGPVRPWTPGAHIDVHLPSGKIRQYSLCGEAEKTDSYMIAVSLDAQSRGGSSEIHETGLVGRTIQVRGPRNHFPLAKADHHVLIAGGIGITPILAMARELSHEGREFRLLYGGRARSQMPFIDEVVDLNGEVLVVPQDERGLPDLVGFLEASVPGSEVHCCGPEGMIRAVESTCSDLNLPLHTERFVSGGRSHLVQPSGVVPADPPIDAVDSEFDVRLQRSGITVPVAPDRSLIDVVREHVPDVPSSCEEGFCGTCETRVLAGTPDHRDSILSDEEREASETMMICVGRSKSPLLTLDL